MSELPISTKIRKVIEISSYDSPTRKKISIKQELLYICHHVHVFVNQIWNYLTILMWVKEILRHSKAVKRFFDVTKWTLPSTFRV